MQIRALSLALIVTSFGLQATAATISTVGRIVVNTVGDPTCGEATSVTRLDQSQAFSVDDNGPACNATATVDINPGVVGIGGSVEQGLGSASSAKIRAVGSIVANGIQLTPIDGLTVEDVIALIGTEISVTANLELEYQLSSILSTASPFSRGAGSDISAIATIGGSRNFSFFRETDSASASSAVTEDGSGFNAQTLRVLPTLTLDWTRPINLTFGLTGSAGAFTTGDSSGGAIFDALNSFSFSTTGPAFLLPEQLTVHAPELGIYNNRWIDPRAPTVAPVPLPAGFTLLMGGLVLLGAGSRRGLSKLRTPPC